MPRRVDLERAVMASALPAPGRHLMHVLSTLPADDSGVVPEHRRRSLTQIAKATGMSRGAVARHLGLLEEQGWIRRDRPTLEKARAGELTGYALLIPSNPGALAKPGGSGNPQVTPSNPGALGLGGVVRQDYYPPPAQTLTSQVAPSNPGGRKRVTTTGQPLQVVGGDVKHAAPRPRSTRKPSNIQEHQFAQFWKTYPRRIGKKAALQKFLIALDSADARTILAGAARYAAWAKDRDQRYVKHPSTWLNQGCWDDELPDDKDRDRFGRTQDDFDMTPPWERSDD